MTGVSELVGKVRDVLQRQDSSSSSSSSDLADSPPGSPGTKQEGKERHAKLAQSLQASVDNSAKPESADSYWCVAASMGPTFEY